MPVETHVHKKLFFFFLLNRRIKTNSAVGAGQRKEKPTENNQARLVSVSLVPWSCFYMDEKGEWHLRQKTETPPPPQISAGGLRFTDEWTECGAHNPSPLRARRGGWLRPAAEWPKDFSSASSGAWTSFRSSRSRAGFILSLTNVSFTVFSRFFLRFAVVWIPSALCLQSRVQCLPLCGPRFHPTEFVSVQFVVTK